MKKKTLVLVFLLVVFFVSILVFLRVRYFMHCEAAVGFDPEMNSSSYPLMDAPVRKGYFHVPATQFLADGAGFYIDICAEPAS